MLKDQEEWRSWDHQAVSSVYVVEGKGQADPANEWDLLKIVSEEAGADVVRSVDNNPVVLEPLE